MTDLHLKQALIFGSIALVIFGAIYLVVH